MLCYDVIVSTEGPKGTERIIIGVEGVVDICVNVVKIIGKEGLVGIIAEQIKLKTFVFGQNFGLILCPALILEVAVFLPEKQIPIIMMQTHDDV